MNTLHDALGSHLLSAPISIAEAALGSGHLEGHLAALILCAGREEKAGPMGSSRWATHRDRMLASEARFRTPPTTSEVAVLGVRIALGAPGAGVDYGALASRELSRQALPPAVRAHDDERLMLGIAAGVGAAAPHIREHVKGVLRSRAAAASYHGAVLDLWAEALAGGSSTFSPELAQSACRLLSEPTNARPEVTDEDRIALFWLATRALDATWQPDPETLATLSQACEEGQRSALIISASPELSALDAAMLLDAIAWSPTVELTRRSAVDRTLEVVDAFTACAAILAKRQRRRQPFVIKDEYDVQDLFHALIKPSIADIVPEDPAPKIAGRSSRLDFTSKATRLGFELKHVKSASSPALVRTEILLDEATYHAHPYIRTVVALILDPERYIRLPDRHAFEADLSKVVSVNGRAVEYVVRVRG